MELSGIDGKNASYLYSQDLRVYMSVYYIYISVYYIYISVYIRVYISGDGKMIIVRGVG